MDILCLDDPINAIKNRMKDLNLRSVDLVYEFGGNNRACEVLHRKRKLTLVMIRKLTKRLNLPAELLIKEYKLGS